MNTCIESSKRSRIQVLSARENCDLPCWLSEQPASFSGGDVNLTRYVSNMPVMATDPSGLTIQLDVAVMIAKGSYAKHKATIDAVLAKATAVLKNLDIALNFTIVEIPGVVKEEGFIDLFDAEHDTKGEALSSDASKCTTYILNQLKKDKKFLAKELAASKIKKWKYVAIIYTEGNGTNGRTYLDTGIQGIQINIKDLLKGIGTINEVGRAFAHEFVAHIIIGYDHLRGKDPAFEMGLTRSGVKDKPEDECVSKAAAAELKKHGADKIDPLFLLPR